MKEIDKEALKANKVLSIKDVEADLKEIEKFNWRNNINYKLKDFVTKEDLESVGFKYINDAYWRGFVGFTVMIDFYDKEIIYDIEDDIQDLIEKGWVEEV